MLIIGRISNRAKSVTVRSECLARAQVVGYDRWPWAVAQAASCHDLLLEASDSGA